METEGGVRIGAVKGDGVIDLVDAGSRWSSIRAIAGAGAVAIADLRSLLDTEKLDYEVELAAVIGAPAKRVSEAEAKDHVFGYTVANDVSARDWQFHTPTFTMGKSFDTHGPIGPWIVTADELDDPHALNLRCYVNGDLRQSSNTGLMVNDLWKQIAYLSTAFTLETGDLIATGTPEGVGVGREPPVFLKPGDVVRCEIDGIGAIQNRVAEPA